MTLWDFLNGAGFWQWVGLLMLAGIFGKCFAYAVGNFRLWGDVTKHKTKNIYAGKEEVKP